MTIYQCRGFVVMSKASSWFSRYPARGRLSTLHRWIAQKAGIHSLVRFVRTLKQHSAKRISRVTIEGFSKSSRCDTFFLTKQAILAHPHLANSPGLPSFDPHNCFPKLNPHKELLVCLIKSS